MTFWKSALNNNSLSFRPSLAYLYFLPLWQLLDQGQDFYGGGGGAIAILASSVELKRICLLRVKILMRHPFPWSQPAFLPSLLSTKAESKAFCYDIVELIMLLYWFYEALSHRGMYGGWGQHSQCASSNSLSSPGAFVLNLEASNQGWISKGQMCLHILSLMS